MVHFLFVNIFAINTCWQILNSLWMSCLCVGRSVDDEVVWRCVGFEKFQVFKSYKPHNCCMKLMLMLVRMDNYNSTIIKDRQFSGEMRCIPCASLLLDSLNLFSPGVVFSNLVPMVTSMVTTLFLLCLHSLITFIFASLFCLLSYSS